MGSRDLKVATSGSQRNRQNVGTGHWLGLGGFGGSRPTWHHAGWYGYNAPAGTTQNRGWRAVLDKKAAAKAIGAFTRNSKAADLTTAATGVTKPADPAWVEKYAEYALEKAKTVENEFESTLKTVKGGIKSSGAKAEQFGEQLELFAKSETAAVKGAASEASGLLKTASKVAPVLGTAAKVGGVALGVVMGAISLKGDVMKIMSAKSGEARLDASISGVGDALSMSPNPVQLGQKLDKELHVSYASADIGVSVYSGLKQAGLNDTASFVLEGVATVVATPFGLVSTGAKKIASWF